MRLFRRERSSQSEQGSLSAADVMLSVLADMTFRAQFDEAFEATRVAGYLAGRYDGYWLKPIADDVRAHMKKHQPELNVLVTDSFWEFTGSHDGRTG